MPIFSTRAVENKLLYYNVKCRNQKINIRDVCTYVRMYCFDF